jgi:hypothetical protein
MPSFMAEQLRQFDQHPRMLAQPGQGEGVTQAVGGNPRAGQRGAAHQGGDGVLDRAHRQGFVAGGAEHRGLRPSGRIPLEELAQRPAGSGVERHLALLEALAVADADRAGPVAQRDVGAAQGRNFADPQTGLQHELDQGVIAPGEAMGTLAGGTQQAMDFGRGQADRFALAGQANRPDFRSDVGGDDAAGLGPAQQPADRFQTAVDRGRLVLAQGEHVLAPGDHIVLGQPR